MRMKSFFAPTMTEAMEMVRFEMGADSIIISTRDEKDGAVITAAIEDTGPDGLRKSEIMMAAKPVDFSPAEMPEVIRQGLTYHGAPSSLAERLAKNATGIIADNPTLALAAAMDETFTFDPVSTHLANSSRPQKPFRIFLMGPPGVGKTITTAKLAALATVGHKRPHVITTDCQRAGGIEQLAAFTRILKIDLKSTGDAGGLSKLLDEIVGGVPVIIDSPGTNPFDRHQMDHLESLVLAAGAENTLVLPASGDAMETADIAKEFASIGATRLVVTRLDMARRLGSILAAADAGRLSLSDVSISPDVAEGVTPLNPVSLARLMMPYTDALPADSLNRTDPTQTITEAAL